MNRPLQHSAPGVSVAVPAGEHRLGQRLVCVAEETPIAFGYNGFPYAVMMATPADLDDFAVGFSLTEGIVRLASELPDVKIIPGEDGITVDISLKGTDLHRHLANRRVRQLRGRTSCGLCGVEDLDDVGRPLARVAEAPAPNTDLVLPALEALRHYQPLSRQTRGAHASAWVAADGKLHTVREDVGRHNSLDKLIGAIVRGAHGIDAGFCLITSRCSYEMVQKAAAAGFSALVSVGAPTSHAIRLATASGLRLYALSRDGEPLLFTSPPLLEPHHVTDTQTGSRS